MTWLRRVTGLPIETELKLRAHDEAPLIALSGTDRLGPATLGPGRTFAELDRYLDTADGRLAAARWACRLRTRHGGTIVSLKGPPEHRPGEVLHRRPELEGPAIDEATPQPDHWPPSAARDLLLELSAGAALGERLRLLQERTEREVTVGARVVGTLTLDDCRVVRQGTELGRLWVVELELAEVEPGATEPVLAALQSVPGLHPDPCSKLEHALALTAGRG